MKLSDFDRAVMVSLDLRKNFWKGIEKQFAQKNVRVERFIVGKQNDPTLSYNLKDGPDVGSWNGHTSNAFYCHSAHRMILQKAYDDGLENILLLEDDVILTDNFDEIMEKVSGEIISEGIENISSINFGANLTWAKSKQVSSHLFQNLEGAYCFQCIGLRRDVIKALLDAPAIGPMDLIHARLIQPAFACYSVFPAVAPQRDTFSYINNCPAVYNQYFLNKGKLV